MAESAINETKVITGKVRLSYCHVFEPYANSNSDGDAKYSTVLLIPKADKSKSAKLGGVKGTPMTTIAAIRRAQEVAKENGKSTKFNGTIPKNLQLTLHDGDEEADLERNPEYEGHWYMTVSSKTKPGIVARDLEPITDSTEVYSGCYVKASINAYPYNFNGKKGVTFGLNHIQKISDGDPLGGRSRADDDFDELDDDEIDEDDLV